MILVTKKIINKNLTIPQLFLNQTIILQNQMKSQKQNPKQKNQKKMSRKLMKKERRNKMKMMKRRLLKKTKRKNLTRKKMKMKRTRRMKMRREKNPMIVSAHMLNKIIRYESICDISQSGGRRFFGLELHHT